MTLDGVIVALRARWGYALGAFLLGVCVAGVLAATAERTFEATSVVLFRPSATVADGADNARARYAELRAQEYRLLVHRPEVLAGAAETLGRDGAASAIRQRVSAEAAPDSSVVLIKARSTDPEEAARVSVAVADALASGVARAESTDSERAFQVDAQTVVAALPPSRPITPRVTLYLAAGMVAGAALGVVVALAMSVWRVGRIGSPSIIPRRVSTSAPGATERGRTHWITGAHLAWALLVATAMPWRSGVYYDGGLDPVVLGKALLAVGALGLSWWLQRREPLRFQLAGFPVLMLCAYLAITVVGALANNEFADGAVVAARVVILLAAMGLLITRYGVEHSLRALMHVLAVIALCAAVTGLLTYSDRLYGGLPPMHPNALAATTAVVCVWVTSKAMSGRNTWGDLLLLAVCLVIIFLTGSRTTMAALLVAVLVMTLRATRVRRNAFFTFAFAVPSVIYLILGTDLLRSIFLRGGTQQVTTLSNRRIAWESAFSMTRDGWQSWFGQGLAHKHIPVAGKDWQIQLLDSAWISAWVQSGALGLVLVVVLAIVTIIRAACRPRIEGPILLGLAILLSAHGFLESGLFDASVVFLVFVVTSLGAGRPAGAPIGPGVRGAPLGRLSAASGQEPVFPTLRGDVRVLRAPAPRLHRVQILR